MSAWYLKKKLGDLCRITIYEASTASRQVVTRKSIPRRRCTSRCAEIYDYSMTVPIRCAS